MPSAPARAGPTTPTRAGRLADASVDHTEARRLTTRRSAVARGAVSSIALLGGSCRNAQSREPSRDSSAILFVTRAESPSQSRLLHADHEKVEVDQQHQASDEVRFAQRGVEQARTK